MTVTKHLQNVLRVAVENQLAEIGLHPMVDLAPNIVAAYQGECNGLVRSVWVERDKWWSKNRGRFTVFLTVQEDNAKAGIACVPLATLMGREEADWKIWATDDQEQFVTMFADGMRNHGIPWLTAVGTPEGLARWRSQTAE
jgi:hypothetical protein